MNQNLFSFGIGDRFGLQGIYQLNAFLQAGNYGTEVIPVWNKSFREHLLVHTGPGDVRAEAENAVKETGWSGLYHVDADHISFKTVEGFLDSSDFFTIDVADQIGLAPDKDLMDDFIDRNHKYIGTRHIPGIEEPLLISQDFLFKTGRQFLMACKEAGRIHKKIRDHKGKKEFITEVSMDEVLSPQSPAELFIILGELAHNAVFPDHIAPRFTGSFHKGIDYTGDKTLFEKEFEQDLMVADYAEKEFGYSHPVKLSVHSGSDKFSIYPAIRRSVRRHNKGLHLKTAGTTWLEEYTGLILGGKEGFNFSKFIYTEALKRMEELLGPYKMVTDINMSGLPGEKEIMGWNAEKLSQSVIHDRQCKSYNPDFRQFIHISYKIAAENMEEFRRLVRINEEIIGKRVTDNLFLRHIKPLFIDQA